MKIHDANRRGHTDNLDEKYTKLGTKHEFHGFIPSLLGDGALVIDELLNFDPIVRCREQSVFCDANLWARSRGNPKLKTQNSWNKSDSIPISMKISTMLFVYDVNTLHNV